MRSGEALGNPDHGAVSEAPPITPLLMDGLVGEGLAADLVAAAALTTRVVRSRLLPDEKGEPVPDSRRSDEIALDDDVLRPLRDAVDRCLPACRDHFADHTLQTIRPARLLRYRSGDAIAQHRDAGLDRVNGRDAIRCVSFSILLSDPHDFEGGELIGFGLHRVPGFERLGKALPLRRGDAVFFSSRMQHEVSPVTCGTRVVAIGHLGRWLD